MTRLSPIVPESAIENLVDLLEHVPAAVLVAVRREMAATSAASLVNQLRGAEAAGRLAQTLLRHVPREKHIELTSYFREVSPAVLARHLRRQAA